LILQSTAERAVEFYHVGGFDQAGRDERLARVKVSALGVERFEIFGDA
jgi:hypothetical protein